jgi:uncharacterized Zn finger protein (UPF0148 family)
MSAINEIFQTYGPEYLERYQGTMPGDHRKVVEAIISCRTSACGVALYQCEQCGEPHILYRSCGNRHCPTCQHHKSRKWLENQMNRQLPGHHFMITFTVPETLRPFVRSNQRTAYSAMFQASSEAIKILAADEKYVGGDLTGFLGVLHTWGRQLHYHPHIHYVVPAGALSTKEQRWLPSRIDFFVPVRALSRLFRAKFRDEIAKAGLLGLIPPEVWQTDWNVNCQAAGAGEHSLRYLAPYVFKVAISNRRIVKVENRTVFFRYKKPRSRRWRIMALEVIEFIRRFLQHVLPTGFIKVRYYGFMNPNSSVSLDELNDLIEMTYGFTVTAPEPETEPMPIMTCVLCGATLRYRCLLLPCASSPERPG